MPRFPATAKATEQLGASVYSSLADQLAQYRGETYPFHVGDTWLEPAAGCHMEDLRTSEHSGIHRYAPPQGIPSLLDALAARLTDQSGVTTTREHLLITTGATGALAAAAGSLLEPGEEVLIPAPYWPLLPGIVQSYHGLPVEVPFLDAFADPALALASLERARTPRTAALYLNSPNNPSGRILREDVLTAVVTWAQEQELWIWSDEVYEDYAWQGPHIPCRRLAPERTLSIHSFSKAYGMAGNRCGYIAGPPEAMAALRKLGTHSFYSTPTAAQWAALRVLGAGGDAWKERAGIAYREVAEATATRLGLAPPEGATFLFFDVAEVLDQRGLAGFLEDLAAQGLLLAPGPSFGPFPTFVRLCYSAASPEVVRRGVEKLALHLENLSSGRSTN